ncbi:seminal metalloprotease 1 [Scaptodrosophila lebanonensis]|uniref:Metalloendopeptidase n=1 Tax=Drosophila lebanonensis TaxID=7225 RepID=A0A6J2U7C4_DROLE|nr:seminal metalloprotease 1 [Scaptodrosophila lebanonensis]
MVMARIQFSLRIVHGRLRSPKCKICKMCRMQLNESGMLCLFLLLSLMLRSGVQAAPRLHSSSNTIDPEEAAGLVEGDMKLNEYEQQDMQGRNGLIAAEKRWPNNLVIYKISEDFDDSHRAAILKGIATLEENTCVRFREAEPEDTAYVDISAKPGGCYTAVGYRGTVQEMNLEIYPLGEGCFRPGTILHEFMHAMGFYHQQSSSIRDDYIQVVYDNIVPGKEFNFKKYESTVVTDFELGYDYDSCLHYRPGAFSINGEDTIIPLDPNAQIGQRVGLSAKDIDKINIMHKCPLLV